MATIKIPTIPEEALVELKISGSFYKATSQVIIGLVQKLTPENYKLVCDKVKNNEPATSVEELNVMLLISLIYTIEKAAEVQKLTVEKEVEVPDAPAS